MIPLYFFVYEQVKRDIKIEEEKVVTVRSKQVEELRRKERRI